MDLLFATDHGSSILVNSVCSEEPSSNAAVNTLIYGYALQIAVGA